MESLQYLHLEQTDLSGPIPPQIGRLKNLEELYLSETCTVVAEVGVVGRGWAWLYVPATSSH